MTAPSSLSLSRLYTLCEERLIATLFGAEALSIWQKGDDLPHSLFKPHLPHLHALAQSYTSVSVHRKVPISDSAANAYAAYYLLPNFAKALQLLSLLPQELGEKPLRILDVGAGPGTGTLAAHYYFNQIESVTQVESQSSMRTVAKRLTHDLPFLIEQRGDLPPERFNLILAMNVLNELSSKEGEELLVDLYTRLDEGGVCIFIEPALFDATQQLMTIRDRAVSHPNLSNFQILYPCTHRNNCPLVNTEDWCHTTLRWERPRLTFIFDELLGFNKHRIKYSALILRKPLNKESNESPRGERALLDTESSRIGAQNMLCGPSGARIVTLPKKQRSDANRVFLKVRQHDRVVVEPEVMDKISNETKVEVF